MFESKGDLELDDIFNEPFETSTTQLKRPLDDNPTGSAKKVCPNTLLNKLGSESPTAIKVVPRKFPGPAGLLPKRKASFLDAEKGDESHVDTDAVCSQTSVRAFNEGPWEQMNAQFARLSDKYNVAWIKSKTKSSKLINQRAPFLAAIVQSIQHSKLNKTISMLLKDATGEIASNILYDLYKEHADVIKVGAVLVLKQLGVLITNNDSQFVAITSKSLVSIYNDLKVTLIQHCSINDILDEIEEIKSRRQMDLVEENSDQINFLLTSLRNDALKEPGNSPLSNKENENSNLDNRNVTKQRFNFKSFKDDNSMDTTQLKANGAEGNRISFSQVSIMDCNQENDRILQNIFEGVDADLLFEDF